MAYVWRTGTESFGSHRFPKSHNSLQNVFVSSVIKPVYHWVLTSASNCCVFKRRRSTLLRVCSMQQERLENCGRPAFRLLTFFFGAPWSVLKGRAGCSPFRGSLPGVTAGSARAQKCLVLLHSSVPPARCLAATAVTRHAACVGRIYMCAN